MLNNTSIILHTSVEEMKHAYRSNDDNYLSDEFHSIITIKHYHFF